MTWARCEGDARCLSQYVNLTSSLLCVALGTRNQSHLWLGSRVLALSHDLVAETERVDALEDAASLEVPKATATRTVVASESSTKASHGFENEQRRLDVSVSGNTAGAPSPAGYPLCGECANGCPSKTYAVVGTGGEMTATTCGLEYGSDYESGSRPGYDTRIVVYEGSSCSSLRCIGESNRWFYSWGLPIGLTVTVAKCCDFTFRKQRRFF